MQQAGVTQIDVFIASHYHEDHYGCIDDTEGRLSYAAST